MGSLDYLEIDKLTGVITVTRNDSFNYHRQNEILVQVSTYVCDVLLNIAKKINLNTTLMMPTMPQ